MSGKTKLIAVLLLVAALAYLARSGSDPVEIPVEE